MRKCGCGRGPYLMIWDDSLYMLPGKYEVICSGCKIPAGRFISASEAWAAWDRMQAEEERRKKLTPPPAKEEE